MNANIKALLDDLGLPYKGNSKSFILTCPRCSKKDKAYIRKSDGRFVCWRCKEIDGFSGKAEYFFKEVCGLTLPEIKERLYGANETPLGVFVDIEVRDFFGPDDEVPEWIPDSLPEVDLHPDFRDLSSPFSKRGVDYLEGRGVPVSVAEQYGILFWPARQSIVFPVYARGRLLGWQTRTILPTEFFDENRLRMVRYPKALTSTGLRKDRTLMFADRIQGDHAILCEGPIDALKAHLCGGNVASMGKAVSHYQLSLLQHSGIKKLYLALDPDAFLESARILREMWSYMEVYDMRPPQKYADLGEMPMDEVKELFAGAPRVSPNHIFLHLDRTIFDV